jgi:hypothetical protein
VPVFTAVKAWAAKTGCGSAVLTIFYLLIPHSSIPVVRWWSGVSFIDLSLVRAGGGKVVGSSTYSLLKELWKEYRYVM